MAEVKLQIPGPRLLHGIQLPSKNDVERLDDLRGTYAMQRAFVYGNGWRLRFMRGLYLSNEHPTVGIAVNRALEVIDADIHVHIDMSGQAPKEWEGVRFGAAREHRHPGTLGAFWSQYWKDNGQLIKGIDVPFSGLYAVEVAAFLGCEEIDLVGFCGDDMPGTAEGHFYDGRRCAPGLAAKHNAWLSQVRAAHKLKINAVTFPGHGLPAVSAVDSYISIDDLINDGTFKRKETT